MITYNWVKIKDKKNFVFDIKTLHPTDPRYIKYWKEEKKRCIEGYWAYDYNSWRFMPPKLYFAVNHGTIMLTDKISKTRHSGRPYLTDLFWELGYLSLESLGFSGFKDSKYTSDERIFTARKNWESVNTQKHLDLFNSDGTFKEYIEPRENMRMTHVESLGNPLYNNTNKNVFTMGSRGK